MSYPVNYARESLTYAYEQLINAARAVPSCKWVIKWYKVALILAFRRVDINITPHATDYYDIDSITIFTNKRPIDDDAIESLCKKMRL